MAPAPDQWPYPEVPSEEDAFLADLEAWHEKRGTILDKEPKVSNKSVNLFKLFKLCEDRGGYDKCSSEKLQWRKLGSEFGLSHQAHAFQVKTVYYKNLASYTIKKVHHQEPPPKEILEDVTARGGEVMTRTLENFMATTASEGQDGDKEEVEDQGTPKAEKMDVDDPSSAGRGGRSLRQAPPPRQFFQPDTTSSRTTRGGLQPSATSPNPSPVMNGSSTGSSNPNSSSFAVQAYEPGPPVPLTLRPIQTPRNNPKFFNDKVERMRIAHRDRIRRRDNLQRGLLLPGTGFDGPNIYTRITNAMRSGVADEQAYALHHLIKISEVRGDRFRFDAFQGLAESLIQKTLDISSLFYDVKWEVSYDIGPSGQVNVLDGLRGTQDILKRISRLPRRDLPGTLQTEDFSEILSRSTEAALVLRNMVLLEANSQHLAQLAPCRDMLSIVLSLPDIPEVVEIKHYMLDTAEQLVRYWPITNEDPLFKCLMGCVVDGQDRGAILSSLRAIIRIGYFMSNSIPLPTLPAEVVQQLQSYLLLEDDQMVQTCLEFLYLYTAIPANVLAFLQDQGQESTQPALLEQLGRFALHNAAEDIRLKIIEPAIPPPQAEELADMPEGLIKQLLTYKENERSSLWLKSMFEESPNSSVTQLELWQAYQNTFTKYQTASGQNALLAAADFIRNVSQTFKSAEARIDPPTEHRPQPKFIIKGIRFRHTPRDLKERPYSRCLWVDATSTKQTSAAPASTSHQMPRSSTKICGAFHHIGDDMIEHVLKDHLGINRNNESSSLDPSAFQTSVRDCHWARCRHFSRRRTTDAPDPSWKDIIQHMLTHMPEAPTSETAALHRKHNRTIAPNDPRAVYRHDNDASGHDPNGYPTISGTIAFEDTMQDEKQLPTGIAYWAVMILRNFARNVPKALATVAEDSALVKAVDGGKGGKLVTKEWMDRLFMDIEHHLWHVLAYNRVLRVWVLELMTFIEKGRAVPKE